MAADYSLDSVTLKVTDDFEKCVVFLFWSRSWAKEHIDELRFIYLDFVGTELGNCVFFSQADDTDRWVREDDRGDIVVAHLQIFFSIEKSFG